MYRLTAQAYFDAYILTEETLELLRRAQDPTQRDQARSDLYTHLQPAYQELQELGIRHLHFHLPDTTSLLRFFQPDRYGDPLLDIRPTVRKANTTLQPAYGFETGRTISGFRITHPVLAQGDHLGSVELSMPIPAMHEEMQRLLPQHKVDLVLKKEHVQDIHFAEHQEHLIQWSEFESLVSQAVWQEDTTMSQLASKLGPRLADDSRAREIVASGRNGAVALPVGSEYFGVTFTAINDTRGNHVGFVTSFSTAPQLTADYQTFRTSLVMVTLVMLLLAVVIFALLRNRSIVMQQRQRLQIINDTLGEGLYVINNHGVITDVNRRAQELLGYSARELIGRIAHDTFHCHKENNYIPMHQCHIYIAVSQGREFTGHEQFYRHDGSAFTARVTSRPILRGEKVVGSVTSFADISEQLKMQQQLRDNEERLRLTMESVAIGLWQWDVLNGTFSWDDICYRMLGYEPNAFTVSYGRWLKMIHPDDVDDAVAQVQRQLKQGITFVVELRYRTADDNWRWIQVRGNVAQWDAHGQPQRVLGTHIDIQRRKQAQLELSSVLHRQETLLASSPAVIFSINPGDLATLTSISGNITHILGYDPSEVTGKLEWIATVVHPDDLEGLQHKQAYWLSVGAGGRCVHEYRMKSTIDSRHHGEWVWVEDMRQAVYDSNGKVVEVVGAFHDISEKVEAQQRLDRIATHVPGMIFEYCLCPDGSSYFSYTSEGVREIYGIAPGEVSQDASKVFQVVHPDDLEKVETSIKRSAQSLRPWQCEYRVILHNGKERWLRGESTPQQQEDGSVHWYGYISDISDRKMYESMLQDFNEALSLQVERELNNALEQENRFQLLFNAIPDAVVAHGYLQDSSPTLFTEVNDRACELFGYRRDELLQLTPMDLHSPNEHEEVLHNSLKLLKEGKVQLEAELLRSDGSLFCAEITVHRQQLRGKPMALTVVRDISVRKQRERERQRNEQALIQQSKMAELGGMMGAIAHQWKQPLNNAAIMLQSIPELYQDGELNLEDIDKTIADIMNLLDFMAETIDDFRSFFKPSTEISLFNLQQSINQVLQIMKGQIDSDLIEVQVASVAPGEQLIVRGYPSEFQQVALNVINNAREVLIERKVSPATISIEYDSTEQHAILRIRDNGGGIPKHMLPDKLFEPFTSTKGEKGTGIGLSLSSRIMEKMHGAISASNDAQGAVFTILLPRG
nr:PAS domain S-box protein [Desulfurispira natronophila]